MPTLSEIGTEYDLYTYLKDGTELCRMIGLVSQGEIMEGIIYRPNNIAALKEKNITLFLNYVEEKMKLKAVFGGLGSKVFEKFANFYVALSGLATLSKSLEKKYEIPKFSSSGRKTPIGHRDFYHDDTEIYGYREDGFGFSFQFMNINMDMDINLERANTSLDFAFEELIAFNAQFLKEILEAFQTYEKKNTSDLLKREFFPVFLLQKLKTLHAGLQVQLEKLQYCYTDIGRIFDDVKDDFIVYCKILPQMKQAMTFFANQMSENPNVIQAVEEMEQHMLMSINELAQMITQRAMRWPLLLEAVSRRAYKERRTDVEQEARKAHQMVLDVFKQMEQVSADCQYKEAMREFAEEVNGCDDLTQYGVLVQIVKEVGFVQGVLGENFKEIELLIFDKCVAVLELRPKRRGKMMGRRQPVDMSEKERIFRRAYQVEDFNVIINKEMAPGPLGHSLLWIKKIKDTKPVEDESFVLKLPVNQAPDMESELRTIHKKVLAKIQEGSKHEGHTYCKYKGEENLDNCSLRCGECHKLMQGLFFYGIKCDTCNGIFHTECFAADKEEDDDDNDCLDPVLHLIQKRFDLVWEDFFVPHADKVTAESLLENRSWGTFLVIETAAGMTLIVKTVNSGELTSYEINTVEIQGETLYYIQKGTSAKNILDLVSCHRRSHHLYTPITLEDYEEDDSLNEEVTDEDKPEAHLLTDEDEHGAHSNYFWGDMTAEEAGQKLVDTPPGTFLLRRNRNQFKLSWKAFHSKLMHATIETVNGQFQFPNFTFNSLHQLTSYFQIQTEKQKIALGWPLLKDVYIKEEERLQLWALDGQTSWGQEYFKIPGFQGKMSAKEAEEMLRLRPDGSYVVRMQVNGNPTSTQATPYRISYKHEGKVSHLKFEISSKGFMATHAEGGQISAATLSEMFDMLKF